MSLWVALCYSTNSIHNRSFWRRVFLWNQLQSVASLGGCPGETIPGVTPSRRKWLFAAEFYKEYILEKRSRGRRRWWEWWRTGDHYKKVFTFLKETLGWQYVTSLVTAPGDTNPSDATDCSATNNRKKQNNTCAENAKKNKTQKPSIAEISVTLVHKIKPWFRGLLSLLHSIHAARKLSRPILIIPEPSVAHLYTGTLQLLCCYVSITNVW